MNTNRTRQTEIAARLRLAREIAGLSQSQVANELSLHRPSVSEIEAARRKVSAEEATRLAKLYRVKLSWLLCTDDEADPTQNEKMSLAARELAKLRREDYDRVIRLLRMLGNEKE